MEITRNKTAYNHHFKSYLDNSPIPSLTTMLGKVLSTDTTNWTYPLFNQLSSTSSNQPDWDKVIVTNSPSGF